MVGSAILKKSLGEMNNETKKLINTLPRVMDTKVSSEEVIYPELEPHKLQFKKHLTTLSENDNNSYNIVIIGPTGSGKSSTINQMFNKRVCPTNSGPDSVTKKLKFYQGDLKTSDTNFDKVTIIDTIGEYLLKSTIIPFRLYCFI